MASVEDGEKHPGTQQTNLCSLNDEGIALLKLTLLHTEPFSLPGKHPAESIHPSTSSGRHLPRTETTQYSERNEPNRNGIHPTTPVVDPWDSKKTRFTSRNMPKSTLSSISHFPPSYPDPYSAIPYFHMGTIRPRTRSNVTENDFRASQA